MKSYRAPDPTPAQLEAAKLFGYDPHARLGLASPTRPIWDMGPDHPLSAAGVIHDMMTLRKLTDEERDEVNRNFDRDAHLLARALPGALDRAVYFAIAEAFADIVYAFDTLGLIDTGESRETPRSTVDNNADLVAAMTHVNRAAEYLGQKCPYPMTNEDETTRGE